jgi:hypothetical protein
MYVSTTVALTRLSSKDLERLVNIGRSVPVAHFPAVLRDVGLQLCRLHRLGITERIAVVQSYAAGESMATLARTFGVRRETISKVLSDAGVKFRAQRSISREQIAEAALLYGRGGP